jgi:hypothetical protein
MAGPIIHWRWRGVRLCPGRVYALTAGAFGIGTTEFVIMGLLLQVAADLQRLDRRDDRTADQRLCARRLRRRADPDDL